MVPRECPTEKIYLYCYLSANSKFSLNWMCSGNALTELGNAGVSKPRSNGAGGLDSAIYRMKLYYPAAKASGRSYCAIDPYSWSVDRDLSRQCIAVSMYLWTKAWLRLEWLCTGSALQPEVVKWKVKRYSLILSKHKSLFSPSTFTETL